MQTHFYMHVSQPDECVGVYKYTYLRMMTGSLWEGKVDRFSLWCQMTLSLGSDRITPLGRSTASGYLTLVHFKVPGLNSLGAYNRICDFARLHLHCPKPTAITRGNTGKFHIPSSFIFLRNWSCSWLAGLFNNYEKKARKTSLKVWPFPFLPYFQTQSFIVTLRFLYAIHSTKTSLEYIKLLNV